MNYRIRNARFWAHVNGSYVKITLKPGQELRHYEAHSTDEGWRSEYNCWALDGAGNVEHVMETDGSDCDGRLSHHSQWFCHINDIPARDVRDIVTTKDFWGQEMGYEMIVNQVPWNRGTCSQRDYEAERAGY